MPVGQAKCLDCPPNKPRIHSMITQSRGKRKTWVTDSLTIQNPQGKISANDTSTSGKGVPGAWERTPVEKYNMYLKGSHRPRTTPMSTSSPLPQANKRLFVNHSGAAVKSNSPTEGKMQCGVPKHTRGARNDWMKPPSTAPLKNSNFQRQHKWMPLNAYSDIAGVESSFCQVLSSVNGKGNWQNGGADCGTWLMSPQATVGKPQTSKGLLGSGSPYSNKMEKSVAGTRKSKRIFPPKKEITQTKLLREVKRFREHGKDHRMGETHTKSDRDYMDGHGAIYISKRVGNTESQPFSFHNIPPRSPPTSCTISRNTIAGKASPTGSMTVNKAKQSVGEGASAHHPLHRTAVNTSQLSLSRATYCQQLSSSCTHRSWKYGSGPAIVSPQLEVGDENVPMEMGKGQKLKGGMLLGCHSPKRLEQTKPPLTAPGCLGTLHLRSAAKNEDLTSPLGYKWTEPQESPRVKGWKFGHVKADSISRRIPGGDSDGTIECEDLTVDGEGSRSGSHLPTEAEPNVEQLHELLALCDQTADLEEANRVKEEPKCLDASEDMNVERLKVLDPVTEASSRVSTPIISDTDNTEDYELRTSSQCSSNDVYHNGFRVLGGKYEVLNVVGEGAYGLVMKCRVRDDPSRLVAIKEFKLEEGDPDAEEVKRTMNREVALLRSLQHPHVVRLIEHFSVAEKVFIVMEFVPMNLLEVLEDTTNKGGLQKNTVRRVIFQVVSAIAFIHQQGVVYRDIKPENVLITKQGDVKLCDFGFARFVHAPEEVLTDYVATRWYRAPELLLGPPFMRNGTKVQCQYGKPVDMWSIGCLMGELLDGEPLFAGDSDIDQLYKIQQVLGPLVENHEHMFKGNPNNQGIVFNIKTPMTLGVRYSGKANAEELDFMEGLLDMNPHKRRTSKECLSHGYLQQAVQDVA